MTVTVQYYTQVKSNMQQYCVSVVTSVNMNRSFKFLHGHYKIVK